MQTISWLSLSWCLIPVSLVAFIFWRWHNGHVSEILIATTRMAVQLIAVGYVLIFLFNTPSVWISLAVMSVMLLAASWIAIRPVRHHQGLLIPAGIALITSVIFHLAISLKLALQVDVWYEPRILIPLAGMFFANSMNSISLTAERYFSEIKNRKDTAAARVHAYRTAMIPQINGLLAVGLVALPGMMTGQILSGVSPLIAVRYQILIMTMLLGTCGLSSALLLWQLSRKRTLTLKADERHEP